MTTDGRRSRLASLRDEVALLKVVECRMAHERVVGEAAAGRVDAPHGFRRVGLCGAGERAERLGCSHTVARTRLERAVGELGSEEGARLRSELCWLDNEIHLLDHRKGAAELQLAAAVRAGGSAGEAGEIERLERLHDEHVRRVGALRDRVVSEMDQMLAEFGRSEGA